jgi:hypothetical protein
VIIKSEFFHVKIKKKLLSEDNFGVVLIDVAESPIERPKKTAKPVFGKEKAAYYKYPSACK